MGSSLHAYDNKVVADYIHQTDRWTSPQPGSLLVYLDRMLDMVGRGLDSFDHTSKYVTQRKEHLLISVCPEVEELACGRLQQ